MIPEFADSKHAHNVPNKINTICFEENDIKDPIDLGHLVVKL